MKKILFLLFLFIGSLYANTIVAGDNTRNFTVKQVKEDMKAQNYEKYSYDNLIKLDAAALVEKNIIKEESQLINNIEIEKTGDFLKAADCSFVNTPWTATIYDFNIKGGTVNCMVAPMGDLNNPIGKFTIKYPKAQKYFSKDIDHAKKENESYLLKADEKFAGLYEKQEEIFRSVGNNHLNLTDIIIAAILTDASVFDLQATADTKKLTLHDNLTTKVFADQNNAETYTDNASYVMKDLESLMINYIKLSDIAMEYWIYIIGFIAVYAGLTKTASVIFKKEQKADHVMWGTGVLAGALLFIPISSDVLVDNKFNHLETKYQDFEKDGYNLFLLWGNASTKAIINTELESMISKSGIGTKEQIINGAAGANQYYILEEEAKAYNNICNTSYNINEMYVDASRTKYLYSDSSITPFPTSENWGYALALKNRFSTYYSTLPVKNIAYSDITKEKFESIDEDSKMKREINEMFYPQIGLASCGKNYHSKINISSKLDDYTQLYADSINKDQDDDKLKAVENLVVFAHELNRDYGMLSILGLPVIKMQTEMIGGIYKNNNEVIKQMKEKMSDNKAEELLHNFISSIPFMYAPGAQTVYSTTLSTIRDLKSGYNQSAAGFIGGIFGANVAVGLAANTLAYSLAYGITKTVLLVLPMIALIIIGFLRFIAIIVKIFGIHFSSLFMLPLMFLTKNIAVLQKFSVKVFSTMVELAVYPVSIYIAMMASYLAFSLGNLFMNTVIVQMLTANSLQQELNSFSWDSIATTNDVTMTIVIYLTAGFAELFMALAPIFIIYKVVVSFHNWILDQLELKTTEGLDNVVDSIRQSISLGVK